jgi:ankyrin repeat protein
MNTTVRPQITPETQLLSAALQGDIASLRAALKAGASPSARQPVTKDGWTALSCAVLSGQEEAVQLLLAAGAEVNAFCLDGTTALHKACLWGHLAIAALLLAHHADQTIQDQEGWTAPQLARAQGNMEMVQLLAAHAPPGSRPPDA